MPAIEDAAPNASLVKAFNPLVKLLFRSPAKRLIGRRLGVLRFNGRRTGAAFELPVGVLPVRGQPAVTSRRGWQHNFTGGLDCEVLLDGHWRSMRGERVADAAETAAIYGELFDLYGWKAGPGRLGLKVTVGRQPTQDELVDAVQRLDLSIILLSPT